MSECKRCRERGQTWKGSAPKCAFESEVFSGNNWNCATMNALRELVEDKAVWNDDQYLAMKSTGQGIFIVLSWYKRRGRTEGAWWVFGEDMKPLTMRDAESVLLQGDH